MASAPSKRKASGSMELLPANVRRRRSRMDLRHVRASIEHRLLTIPLFFGQVRGRVSEGLRRTSRLRHVLVISSVGL